MHKDVRVIDDYFPQWMVDEVSQDVLFLPVTYSNSPYAVFEKARFFGNMLMEENLWKVPGDRWWFADYLNLSIMRDILKDYNIPGCYRILLNGQTPGQDGDNHTDSDSDKYTSVIYHAHGTSGDTVFVNAANEDVERVSFKPGRLVIFNSSIWHRGEAPKDGYRVSLGCVYPHVPISELVPAA